MVVYFLSAERMIKSDSFVFAESQFCSTAFFFYSENNSGLHCHSEFEPKFL